MDYFAASQNLIKLLCVSIETLSLDSIKDLVRKRYRQWHPDKNHENPERYREQFMLLKESFDVYKKGPPQDSGNFSADDLYCDEDWDPSWDNFNSSDSDEDYNSTPFDDEFFTCSPKKNFAVPEELRLYFRSKTNRRAGKLFMLFSFRDAIFKKALENYSKDSSLKSFACFSARTNKEIYCVLIVTHNELRLLDVKKYGRKYSLIGIEIFYAVHQRKLYDKLIDLYGQPEFVHGEPLERPPREESTFSQQQLTSFAISTNQTNVMLLMYEYAHLAGTCDRENITKEHDEDHINEKLNASKFVKLNDRYKVCSAAVKCVHADMCGRLYMISNTRWLENRSREFSERLLEEDNIDIFGQAFYLWKYIISQRKFFQIMAPIIAVFTNSRCRKYNDGKKRYVAIKGPCDSGKTTLAAGICKFFDGVNINVNVPKDRIQFYIGSAIGQRFVLFDDVKGYKPLEKNLPTGTGISNLDDMRDHLDGKLEVQLEKKNQNTINQLYPSGLITMNNYKLPKTLKNRLHIVNLRPKPMYNKHTYRITMDTIFIAMAIDNLIPCDRECLAHIHKHKQAWVDKHNKTCKCMQIMVSYGCWYKYYCCFYSRYIV